MQLFYSYLTSYSKLILWWFITSISQNSFLVRTFHFPTMFRLSLESIHPLFTGYQVLFFPVVKQLKHNPTIYLHSAGRCECMSLYLDSFHIALMACTWNVNNSTFTLVSTPEFIQCQMRNGRKIMFNKLRTILKKVIAAYWKVLSTSQRIPQCCINPRCYEVSNEKWWWLWVWTKGCEWSDHTLFWSSTLKFNWK